MSGPEYRTITLREPTETFADRFAMAGVGGPLRFDYWGPSHCEGHIVISLAAAKVAFLGDLLFVGRFPWLGDCDLDGWIATLDRILGMDLKTVVPGHGPVATLKEVAAFRGLLHALRQAVARSIRTGASEEAAIAEIVLADYASMPRYREWMPFNVRAAYRYLKAR
jgi:glyoxylase-like metal-dependent hydrolase (beta-lactamase superfamily II)